jgi:hypothetical protein
MIIGQEMAEIRHGGGGGMVPFLEFVLFWRLRAGKKSCNTFELQYYRLQASAAAPIFF